RMTSVRHLSKKARYDIGDRDEDEKPERRERAEERGSCSQRIDNEREGVLNDVEPRALKRLGCRPMPRGRYRRKDEEVSQPTGELQRPVDHRREWSELRVGKWAVANGSATGKTEARCWPR